MKKAHNKAVKANKATQVGMKRCSLCGGMNTWPERGYCFDCGLIYGTKVLGTPVVGFIDGDPRITHQMRIRVYRDAGKINDAPVMVSVSNVGSIEERLGLSLFPYQHLGTKNSGGRTYMRPDSTQTISGTVVTTTKVDDDALPVEMVEEEVVIKNATLVVSVRYPKEQPDLFVVKEYKVEDFEKIIEPLVLSVLQPPSEATK